MLIIIPSLVGLLTFGIITRQKPTTIKVGILHSITGPLAGTERPVIDATLHAINEINEAGGLLGKQIEPIFADGQSHPEQFARAAEDLIKEQHVSVIFGCWTSSSRKSVKPIVEKYNNLLFYPVQFEGLETSNNIIYSGITANQQVIPALAWSVHNIGKRIFLIGSDYIFPHAAHALIKAMAPSMGGEIVGEQYIPLGSNNIALINKAIENIQQTKPDVIFNTINGTTNNYFFQQLRQAGITPQTIPTFSFSMAEESVLEIGPALLAGDYAVLSYFQTVQTTKNREFLSSLHERFGPKKMVTDPAEAGYTNVYLWANAVKASHNTTIENIKKHLGNESFDAPQGPVFIDPKTFYAWKTIRVGKISKEGDFIILWDSEKPLRPIPYPHVKTQEAWEKFLLKKYNEWGQHWEHIES